MTDVTVGPASGWCNIRLTAPTAALDIKVPGSSIGGMRQRERRMTIGTLARRTGIPVKMLRAYEDMGLIYTVGRSPGNYRLFDEDALWCVGVVGGLRSLGLTLAEIRELAATYLGTAGEPAGPRLAELLSAVRARTLDRIDELEGLLKRVDAFEADRADELAGRTDFRAQDPRSRRQGLDSPPGGKT